MSLAPASSRGFFLNARLAVNGIQCAARSFGTLTLVGWGLLSSMAGLFGFGWDYLPRYQFRAASGTPGRRDISAQSRGSYLKFARDRRPRSRTLRPLNPRYRARAAAIAGKRPQARAGNGRFRRAARRPASDALWPRRERA